jgi:fumarate hydratase class I
MKVPKMATNPKGPMKTPPAVPATHQKLFETLLELIRVTSTNLPPDVRKSVVDGLEKEKAGSAGEYAMKVIQRNIDIACGVSQPLCQDTGSILFFVKTPVGYDQITFAEVAEAAVAKATELGYLRQNSVDSITGHNSGNNLGPGTPTIYFEQHRSEDLDIRLALKGGGCENVGAQYSLPDSRLGAGRDLEGVRKVVLDAVYQAQGKGCGPGILGVVIGGDRSTGYSYSKKLFLRPLDDENPDGRLAELEKRITQEANSLGIGPMGFGGNTTLLGVKIAALNRLPASFYVSVSYMCWAFRRQGVKAEANGALKEWIYK